MIKTNFFKTHFLLFFIGSLLLCASHAYAQEASPVTIKGQVVDDQGLSLPGASVVLKTNVKINTMTNENGEFSITVPEGSTLEVSFIGMKSKEITAVRQPESAQQIIALESEAQTLDEVVVTGYQTISKERATGAFEIVNSKMLDKKITVNATAALEGEAAGVNTYGGSILIRGISTFSPEVGTRPLLVIDGLPTERDINDINMNDVESLTVLKDAAASSIYGVRAANGVIVITTKKADEGKTRVHFTSDWRWTKNPSLSDYHYASTSDIMNYELATYERSARLNYGGDELTYFNNTLRGIGEYVSNKSEDLNYVTPLFYLRHQYLNGAIDIDDYNSFLNEYRNMDYRQEYIDNVWRMPFRQSYNLSISSSSTRQNSYASINYIGNRQQVGSDNSRQLKGYLKSSQKITKWLTVEFGLDILYNNTTYTDRQYTDFTGLEAYTRILDENGNRVYRDYVDIYNQTYTNGLSINPKILNQIAGLPQFDSYKFNILDELDRNKTKNKNYNIRSFVSANFNIYKGLTFKSSFDYEFGHNETETLTEKDAYYMRFSRNRYAGYQSSNIVMPAGARFYAINASTDNYVFRNQFDYKTYIGDDHYITASGGMEMRQVQIYQANSTLLYGYDPTALSYSLLDYKTLTDGVKTSYIYNNVTAYGVTPGGSPIKLGDPYTTPSLNAKTNRYVSFYAAGGYTYKGRYGLSGSIRIDQANLFGTNPKYRYRPLWSIGAKWNASKEQFMSNLKWIDMLDVRASFGLTGNVDQTTSPYIVANTNLSSNAWTAQSVPSATVSTAPNPWLRWEKTMSYGGGIDFSLWQGLLTGKIDAYYKYSDDLLTEIEVDFTTGFSKALVNYGAMSNKGLEMTLSSPWFQKKDWTLTSSFVFSYNKNAVEKSNYTPTTAEQLVYGSHHEVGRPLHARYVYRYEGLTNDGATIDQNGVPIIVSANGIPQHSYNPNGTVDIAPNNMKPGDVLYMGSQIPVWNGSFTQGVKYKNWELSGMFVFYGGHKILKPSFDFTAVIRSHSNVPDWITTSWSPTNQTSTIPKSYLYYSNSGGNLPSLNEMYNNSTANVAKGNFIRLRTLSLSYTLPQKYCEKIGMESVKLTGQVDNLWFWSAAGKDIDPETLASNYMTPPTPTSFFLRLDILF